MIKKILLSMISLFVLLIILLFIWLAFLFNPNDHKAWITQKINNDGNLNITFQGKLDFSLWSMQLRSQEVAINAQNGTFKSHWRNATITINPVNFLTHPRNPFESLTLSSGRIEIQSGHIFNVPKLNVIESTQQYKVTTELTNNLQQLLIELTLIPHTDAIEIKDLRLQTHLNDQPVDLSIPNLYLSDASPINSINNIRLTINDQVLIGKLSQVTLRPTLSAKGRFFAPEISVDKLLDLNGFSLQLQQFAVDFLIQNNPQQAPQAKLSIHAKKGKLVGIDLNSIAYSTQSLLAAVDKGDGIGSAFQTLKTRLLPLFNQAKFIADPSKTTTFKTLAIESEISTEHLLTQSINWQAAEFSITGNGMFNFAPKEWHYPLSINIPGKQILSIPYMISYQNKQFTAGVDQEKLQRNLQPIIEKALTEALSNKLGSFFR